MQEIFNKMEAMSATTHGSRQYPDEIKVYEFRSVWTCTGTGNKMGEIVLASNQALIECITGARLVADLNSQCMFIGADSEKDMLSAQRKLENIRTYSVSF